jgi:hypothetical protein
MTSGVNCFVIASNLRGYENKLRRILPEEKPIQCKEPFFVR